MEQGPAEGPTPPPTDDATACRELVATAMASGGDAVARDRSGKAVFIRGALPGERVRARLVEDRRRYSTGRVEQVVEASPDRVEPRCPEVARGCGACQWQHVDVSAQQRLKIGFITEAVERSGLRCPVPAPSPTLDPWAFRTTIRAAVSDGRAGFYRAGSHRVVAVDGCLVAHPMLEELVVSARYPGARSVVLRCGERTGERFASTSPAGHGPHPPGDVRTDHVHEVVAGRVWRISPRSFFQSRPDGADALAEIVARAAAEVGTPSAAVDLYTGVGLFAGVLAEAGWSVTAVEGSHAAVGDARHNLRDLPVEVVRADVTRWVPVRADLVVADPSRLGLGPDGVEVVAGTGARRVVLVSCDVGSLGRDAARLQQVGYELTAVTHVDLFPHTFRVEAVSVFDR
jgi:23S rRNA (uracil1939-C5)-methyltransferase